VSPLLPCLCSEIVAPECLNPGISYHAKWFFIEALPLLLISVFALIHAGKVLYKWTCTSKKRSQLNAHLPTLISTIIVVFRLLYLYLTRTSMDALSCLTTTPPEFRDRSDPLNPKDPVLYMAGQIDYPCWQGWHLILFPMGLAFLMLYSITLPLAALWFLRSKRDAIKTDQLLRCKNTGFDELSNPRFYRFRCVATRLVLSLGAYEFDCASSERCAARCAVHVTHLCFPPRAPLTVQQKLEESVPELQARQVVLGERNRGSQGTSRKRSVVRPSRRLLSPRL